ncbi:hypothetical protein ACE6H2_009430 [Prunus campanulata]
MSFDDCMAWLRLLLFPVTKKRKNNLKRSAQKIWKVIKENKYLDLPAHEVMVATVRCKEIANEKYADFSGNEEWSQFEEAVQFGPISGFGKKLSSILDTCLSEYDAQATYFDEGVRTRKRKQLEEKLLQVSNLNIILVTAMFPLPFCPSVLLLSNLRSKLCWDIRSGSLDKFKEAFDKALNGEEAFSVAAHNCSESFMALFDEGCADAVITQANWDISKVRDQLKRDIETHIASVCAAKLSELTALNETESAVSGISSAFSGFDMDEQSKGKILSSPEAYARVRLDDDAADNIENTLSLVLMDSTNTAAEDRTQEYHNS